MSIDHQNRCRNVLMRRMNAADFDALTASAEVVDLKQWHGLSDPGQVKADVFFPETGVASVTSRGVPLKIEIGLIGRDGFVGIPLLLGTESGPSAVFVQKPGTFVRIKADTFLEAVEASRDLSRLLLRYVHAYIIQVSSTLVAGSTLNVEQRLARWLLMAQDRADQNQISLTHEFLSMMLGVRRPGVTVATHVLEGQHAIKAARGTITITDREKLKALVGDSYGVAEAEYERIIGEPIVFA